MEWRERSLEVPCVRSALGMGAGTGPVMLASEARGSIREERRRSLVHEGAEKLRGGGGRRTG